MKKALSIIFVVVVLLIAFYFYKNMSSDSTNITTNSSQIDSWVQSNSSGNENNETFWSWMQMWGGGGWNVDKSNDLTLQNMISETKDKFKVLSYTDKETWKTISYNLYIPENYDPTKSYPIITFIWDASTVWEDVTKPLTQWYGWIIWATQSEQSKHESFVLVPQFPEVIIDDHWSFTTTDYIDIAKRLIDNVAASYSIDKNKIYVTWQSMWCMTFIYLSTKYPDLFAWELFVSGQWDISALDNLKSQKFTYIVSMWDSKASVGQAEVKAMFDSAGIKYWSLNNLDAQAWDETLSSSINKIYNEKYNNNFFDFKAWTTIASWSTQSSEWAGEHMTSFDYAYKISALRDWLFTQSK